MDSHVQQKIRSKHGFNGWGMAFLCPIRIGDPIHNKNQHVQDPWAKLFPRFWQKRTSWRFCRWKSNPIWHHMCLIHAEYVGKSTLWCAQGCLPVVANSLCMMFFPRHLANKHKSWKPEMPVLTFKLICYYMWSLSHFYLMYKTLRVFSLIPSKKTSPLEVIRTCHPFELILGQKPMQLMSIRCVCVWHCRWINGLFRTKQQTKHLMNGKSAKIRPSPRN